MLDYKAQTLVSMEELEWEGDGSAWGVNLGQGRWEHHTTSVLGHARGWCCRLRQEQVWVGVGDLVWVWLELGKWEYHCSFRDPAGEQSSNPDGGNQGEVPWSVQHLYVLCIAAFQFPS